MLPSKHEAQQMSKDEKILCIISRVDHITAQLKQQRALRDTRELQTDRWRIILADVADETLTELVSGHMFHSRAWKTWGWRMLPQLETEYTAFSDTDMALFSRATGLCDNGENPGQNYVAIKPGE